MQVTVGTVGAARGLKGQVAVYLRTDLPELRFTPGAQLTTNSSVYPILHVRSAQQTNKAFFVTFVEITNRNAAEELRGTELYAEVDTDTELEFDEDAFYPSQLRGCVAIDPEGNKVGVVADLEIGVGQDRLHIVTDNGTVQLPFVLELVPEVDLDRQQVTVIIPSGLMEL